MTAHRLVRPVLVLYAYRLAAGLAVAYPTTVAVVSTGVAPWPEGDRALFSTGGFELLETLRLAGTALPAAGAAAAVVTALLALIAVGPLAVATAALADPAAGLRQAAARAVEVLPRFVFLLGIFCLADVAVVALGALAARGTASLLGSAVDERVPHVAAAVAATPFAATLLALGIVHDLARAAIIRGDRGIGAAARRGFELLRTRPVAVLVAGAAPTVAGAAVVLAAAALVAVIDVSRPGAHRVAAVLLVHQAAVLSMIAFHAAWLARAIELVGPAPPEADRDDATDA